MQSCERANERGKRNGRRRDLAEMSSAGNEPDYAEDRG